jgi:hemerythrin-like metal-binding protein
MTSDLALNIQALDTKHDEFLVLLKELQNASKDRFLPLFEELIAHTQEHFDYEEHIMTTHAFYDTLEHQEEHKNLLEEMRFFYEKSKKMRAFGLSYVNEYAYEKFKRHIINIDSQLAMFIKQKKIQDSI